MGSQSGISLLAEPRTAVASLCMLRITIVSSRGLFHTLDRLNPYCSFNFLCMCEVLDKPLTRFETAAVGGCLDPIWHHHARLDEYCQGDALVFSVCNRWEACDRLLGTAVLPSKEFAFDGF